MWSPSAPSISIAAALLMERIAGLLQPQVPYNLLSSSTDISSTNCCHFGSSNSRPVMSEISSPLSTPVTAGSASGRLSRSYSHPEVLFVISATVSSEAATFIFVSLDVGIVPAQSERDTYPTVPSAPKYPSPAVTASNRFSAATSSVERLPWFVSLYTTLLSTV